jgi:hypothetical protein
MSRPRSPRHASTRSWLSGLAITITTLVGLFGFWRLAPGTTFIIACVALVGLVVSLFLYRSDPNQSSD